MRKKSIITAVSAALAIMLFLFYVNRINLAIRISEIAVNLQEIDSNERSIDNIGLIATYEISKKIYEKNISRDDADRLEQTVAMLISGDACDSPGIRTEYGILALPGMWLINFNRLVLGKKPITYGNGSFLPAGDLDAAYYYERNFMFDQAISLYDKILGDRRIDSRLRSNILLHRGYCHALSGMNEKARANYLLILEEYPQESSAVTAAILLKYLDGFRLAHERILDSNADPLTMSRDLMDLLAYRQALKVLEKTERNADNKDIPMIKYFMARCYTGMGQPGTAVEIYIDIITGYPSSDYARYSNRKILLIGIRSGDQRTIETSKKINTRLKDPVFSQIIDGQDWSIPVKYADLAKISIPEKYISSVDKYAGELKPGIARARKLVITTSDGNTFKGTLIKETEGEIVIMTSIGVISVKKEKITSVKDR